MRAGGGRHAEDRASGCGGGHRVEGGAQQCPAPRRVQFKWGAVEFEGLIKAFSESIDYFSAGCVPPAAR